MFYCLVLINLFGVENSPSRTMGWPPANVTAPARHQANATDPQAEAVVALMSRWEMAATRHTVPWRAEREILRFRVTSRLNGHAATAMEALLGQIDARQLRESHDWRIVESANWETCLEAVPKDETDRLFYQSIRVWLQSSTGQLVKLQLFDRHGEPTAHWLAPETMDLAYVLPGVMSDDGVPPPPPVDKFGQRIRRIADARTPMSKDYRIQQALARLNAEPSYRDDADLHGLFQRDGDAVVIDDQASPEDKPGTTPEIDAILGVWEASSQRARILHTRFTRTVYDLVGERELVSKADLIYDTSGKIRLSISHGGGDAQKEKSKRIGKSGNTFRIIDDRSQSWLITPSEIIQTDDVAKSYEVVTWAELGVAPADVQPLSQEILPFLLDIHAAQLRREWSFSLRNNSKKLATLIATSRTKHRSHPISQCYIMLDKQTWQIAAVKYFHADGITETVYKVVGREMDPRYLNAAFDLDLKDYRRIRPESGNDTPLTPQ